MRISLQVWWKVCRIVLTTAILLAVGWQFWRILSAPELWQSRIHVRWTWTISVGILYLLGIGCSAFFWFRLMHALGQHPSLPRILRAYYVGQLGRYIPGKVVGVLFRAQLMTGQGIRMTTAALTIVYEALTTLTAGALLSGFVLLFRGSETVGLRWQILGLVLLLSTPLVSMIFPRLTRRFVARFSDNPGASLPRIGTSTLLEGLAVTACGWFLQGASLTIMVCAILPSRPLWSLEAWVNCTAAVALATVVGFLVVTVPSGLGVREFILQRSLATELVPILGSEEALTASVVTVLLLRLIWTIAEVALAAVLYLVPASNEGLQPDAKLARPG